MAKKKKNKPKGFSYYLEDEKLIAFSKWTMAEKLRWLEEVNEFTALFETKKTAKIREMFKNGEL